MKTYLNVFVTKKENSMESFITPLKLSEINLINKLVKKNHSVYIRLVHCTNEQYKSIFG